MSSGVSVILVNWNGKKWLERCLDSLLGQSEPPLEIVLVDNASSDGSREWVQAFYPDVRLVEQAENVGFARAVNAGIAVARGREILLFNNDAWVHADFLAGITAFKRESGLDVVAPYEWDYEGRPQPRYTSRIDLLGHPMIRRRESGAIFYLPGSCLLFEKALYQETGGLDGDFFMYCEEVDWFWRLNLYGKTFGFFDGSPLCHYGAGSSAARLNPKIFRWRNHNTLQMLLKNYRASTLGWVLPLSALQNLAEILFFLLIFRPDIALTYPQGWWLAAKGLPATLRKRGPIARRRIIGDLELMRRMYWGPAKLSHLRRFVAERARA
ncbi:MAG: glycosyltransferase family 2 protein [Candidatus Peribacteraceae bacterium]|nr:glycosyltransferase family 2 protein [Candidatus Peribacteraceae bacterium]